MKSIIILEPKWRAGGHHPTWAAEICSGFLKKGWLVVLLCPAPDEALKAMGDCDLILFLAPVTDSLKYYEDFLEKNKKNTKHILLLTKIDFVNNDELMLKLKEYEKYSDKYEAMIPISIKKATKKSDILDVGVK